MVIVAVWEVLSPHVSEMVVFRGEKRKGSSKSDALDAAALAERLRTNRLGHPPSPSMSG